jgi:hypothetical protein
MALVYSMPAQMRTLPCLIVSLFHFIVYCVVLVSLTFCWGLKLSLFLVPSQSMAANMKDKIVFELRSLKF